MLTEELTFHLVHTRSEATRRVAHLHVAAMLTERERRNHARREFMREEVKRSSGILLAVGYFVLFRALFVVSLLLLVVDVARAEGACAPPDPGASTLDALDAKAETRMVDISMPIEQDSHSDPPMCAPNVTYTLHSAGSPLLDLAFPGLRLDDLPGQDLWAVEHVEMCTHSGTHIDAPWHYSGTMSDGSKPMTIEEVPLSWFTGRGVKLDFRALPDGHVVTALEIELKLIDIGHTLVPGDVVLMNTAASAARGTERFVHSGCGFGRDATMYLTGKGVRLVGTDAWSWDAPFVHTARKYATTKDASIVWEGHKAGRETPYCQIEKLANLEKLPATGFTVVAFPVTVKGGSGGWTRAVAILD